jgi:uncharacterized membrane protein (DUF4010 family)
MGFANYILLKLYGPRGITITGFLGGLVNSTVTVTELAARVKEDISLIEIGFRGMLLATCAMLLRNAVLLGIIAPLALGSALLPLTLMWLASLVIFVWQKKLKATDKHIAPLPLHSPFSLRSTLKFGLFFVILEILGTLAQHNLGHAGFYTISIIGGLISSASAVASAGTLAHHGTIPAGVAGTGAVLASLMSALINLPLVAQVPKETHQFRRLGVLLSKIVTIGVIGIALQATVFQFPKMWEQGWRDHAPNPLVRFAQDR